MPDVHRRWRHECRCRRIAGQGEDRGQVRDARARAAPDLVERDFTADAPDRLWVADITFYEATVVKRESGYVSGTTPVLPRSSGPELRIARLGTFLSSGARRVARTLLLSGRFPAPRRIRAPIPHAAGATFREMGPIYIPASFSPGDVRSHIRPAQRRPHPAGLDWQIPCRSGAAGAHRHETGLGEPPQCNEQLGLCCKLGEGAMRDQGASCSPYDSALARRSCSNATASVRAHGPRAKARSTIRASPTMPPWRANIPAWPLRSARITSKPLIVA